MKPGFGSAGGWEARRWARAEAGVRAGVVARRWARRRVAERDFEATLEGGGGVSERGGERRVGDERMRL